MVSTITRDELKAKLERKEKLILVEALPATYRDEGADRNKWLYSYNPLTVDLV